MKQLIYFVLFTFISISLLTSSACKKKPEPEQKFTARCTINGQEWKADITGGSYYGPTNLIGFALVKNKHLHTNVYVPWDMAGFDFLKKTLVKQTAWGNRMLNNGSYDTNFVRGSFGIPEGDGHITCDIYYCLESDSLNNWVQITRAENDYQKIWGTFSMTLLRHRTCVGSTYPDTLYIRDGEFYVEIEPR